VTAPDERDADGLLPATRALYTHGRAAAEPLLPPDAVLTAVEAAFFGRLDRLAEVIDGDPALVDALSPDGFAPLHAACFSGGAETTRLLLARGADREALSQASFARVRPLGTAAFSGDVASAEALLEAGADPNGTSADGGTPLQSARANGYAELERLLLAHGAT
jgi:ankyrin repeat protein